MPDISKTQRLLDLIAFLVGRRLPVPVEEIMEEVPAYAGKWCTGDDTDESGQRRERPLEEAAGGGGGIRSGSPRQITLEIHSTPSNIDYYHRGRPPLPGAMPDG